MGRVGGGGWNVYLSLHCLYIAKSSVVPQLPSRLKDRWWWWWWWWHSHYKKDFAWAVRWAAVWAMKAKSLVDCSWTSSFRRERWAEAGTNLGLPANQPSALPPGQTRSHALLQWPTDFDIRHLFQRLTLMSNSSQIGFDVRHIISRIYRPVLKNWIFFFYRDLLGGWEEARGGSLDGRDKMPFAREFQIDSVLRIQIINKTSQSVFEAHLDLRFRFASGSKCSGPQGKSRKAIGRNRISRGRTDRCER